MEQLRVITLSDVWVAPANSASENLDIGHSTEISSLDAREQRRLPRALVLILEIVNRCRTRWVRADDVRGTQHLQSVSRGALRFSLNASTSLGTEGRVSVYESIG